MFGIDSLLDCMLAQLRGIGPRKVCAWNDEPNIGENGLLVCIAQPIQEKMSQDTQTSGAGMMTPT